MKKWTVLVFVSLLVFILAGCQKKDAADAVTAAAASTEAVAVTTKAVQILPLRFLLKT